MDAVNLTQFAEVPSYVCEYADSPRTTLGSQSALPRLQTSSVTMEFVSVMDSVGATPFLKDHEALAASDPRSSEGSDSEAALRKMTDARLTLLVGQYEGRSSREDDVRFEILTHRLRKLSPVIAPGDLNGIEKLAGRIESEAPMLEELEKRLGLL